MFAGAVAVGLAVAPSSFGFRREMSAYGRPLAWGPGEIVVVVRSLPSQVNDDAGRAAIRRAVETWRGAGCDVPLSMVDVEKAGARVIAVEVPARWPRKASEAGWTEVDANKDSGAITGARVLLNPAMTFDDQDPVAPDRVDLASLVVHELGHALGLAHSFDRRALMKAGITPGERRRALTDDDRAGVCAVFASSTR